MADTVFSIQELCDHIAHQIEDNGLDPSHSDLKSLALVCQTMGIAAQSQIFHHVILDPAQLPRRASGETHTPLQVAHTSLRLSDILATSPRLLSLIRRLSIFANAGILEPLTTIQLPVLQQICVRFAEVPWSGDNVIRFTQRLIALPSIREVHVVGGWHNYPLDLLESLFETCARSLESLSFHNVVVPPTPFTPGITRPRQQRLQIKRLKLLGTTSRLTDWLTSPLCPFDFTHLVDVEIQPHPQDSTLVHLVTSARLSITRLGIFGRYVLDVNFSQFPVLKSLEIELLSYRALSNLSPQNSIEILLLHAPAHVILAPQRALDLLSRGDTAVAASPLPCLREVEIRVTTSFTFHPEVDLESMKACFPELKARGLLVLTSYKY
ncbi:hypothetical protein DFH09DRAFT_1157833 [Mycena vulgaris]|nr:hypothetical protein DFH09DRAFT_1157833 [Mycena vulgaris]